MTLTLGHFLSLGAILFALSVVGIFLNRKNLIVLLMAPVLTRPSTLGWWWAASKWKSVSWLTASPR
jgi:NADH:ubiquinone oxidoreductase subunit K